VAAVGCCAAFSRQACRSHPHCCVRNHHTHHTHHNTEDACTTQLKGWEQCGGKSGGCPGPKCVAAQWDAHCCPSGYTCVRNDDYYYQCRPESNNNNWSQSNNNQQQNNNNQQQQQKPGHKKVKPGPPIHIKKAANGKREANGKGALRVSKHLASPDAAPGSRPPTDPHALPNTTPHTSPRPSQATPLTARPSACPSCSTRPSAAASCRPTTACTGAATPAWPTRPPTGAT